MHKLFTSCLWTVCCDYQTETCFKKIKMILILIVSLNKIYLLCLGAECIRMTPVLVQAAFGANRDFYLLLQLYWLVNGFLSWLYKIELAECQTENENLCGNCLWSIVV